MDDQRLEALLTGSSDLSKASLATRILVSRLRIEVRAKPASLPAKLEELKAFIARNAFAGIDLNNP
jgi:hypothetical protein